MVLSGDPSHWYVKPPCPEVDPESDKLVVLPEQTLIELAAVVPAFGTDEQLTFVHETALVLELVLLPHAELVCV